MKNLFRINFPGSFLSLSVLLLYLSVATQSCTKEEPPVVITHVVSTLTSTSAKVAADVTSDGGASVVERGVAWGLSEQPEITDNMIDGGTGTGMFICDLTELTEDTKYYARGYARNSAGLSYGNQVVFTTTKGSASQTNVIELGANSRVRLGTPVESYVELVSSLANLGPGTMNYLKFHTLYPVNRINQEVVEIDFFPAGGQMITDSRRQPLVHYEFNNILPGTNTLTYWRALVRTRSITYEIDPDDVGDPGLIPQSVAEEYLADGEYWKITDPVVIAARDEALQGETHPLEMAKKIYYWVQNHMSYVSGLGWADAPTNITRAEGTCSDYAFVFIAMCRSAGIPARWTGALVRRGSQSEPGPHYDLYHHRWAQVYMPGIGWMEANVQGGQWGYLHSGYLVISEASGPSDYMGIRYDSYRRWGFSGSGTTATDRYGLWWPQIDSPGNEPAVPGLISPVNGATGVTSNQELSWSAVPLATSYRLEVSSSADFSNLRYYNGEITGTSHIPQWTDNTGTTWYWRVYASNMAGISEWSAVWSFSR